MRNELLHHKKIILRYLFVPPFVGIVKDKLTVNNISWYVITEVAAKLIFSCLI